MAVKAVCCITDTQRDPNDHTHFVATLRYAGLVDTSYTGTKYIFDLDPGLLGSVLTDTIQSNMKASLVSDGMSFGLLDTVRLVPGIL